MGEQSLIRFTALAGMLLTILVIVVGQNARTKNTNQDIETKNKTGRIHKPDIMYDGSYIVPFDRKLNPNNTVTENTYEYGNISPVFYYDVKGLFFRDICWPVNVSAYGVRKRRASCFINILLTGECKSGKPQCVSELGLEGISLVVHGNGSKDIPILLVRSPSTNTLLLNLLDGKRAYIEGVTFKINYYDSLLYCPKTLIGIANYLQESAGIFDSDKRIRSKVKLGLEYDDGFLRCFEGGENRLIKSLNHTILQVDINPSTTLLSFSHYSKMMDALLTKNRYAVRKFNTNCVLYVRLTMRNWRKVIDSEAYDAYETLVSDFFQRWSAHHNGKEIFILNPTQKHAIPLNNNQFIKESVNFPFYGRETFTRNSTDDIHVLACETIQVVKNVRSVFNNVIIVDPSQEILTKLMTKCQYANDKVLKLENNELQSNWLLFTSETSSLKLIQNMHQELHDTGFHTVYFDYRLLKSLETPELLTNITNILRSAPSGVGCYLKQTQEGMDNTTVFIEKTVELCGPLFNASTDILMDFQVNIKENYDLLIFLGRVHQIKETFEKEYPEKYFNPMITPTMTSKVAQDPDSFYATFCSSVLKTGSEYIETIIAFANIHKWKKLSLSINPGHPDFVGLWKHVKTNGDIDRSLTSFPVLYLSNAENTELEQLPWTYPCVKWTKNASETVINFLGNRYAGATFDVRLRPYTDWKERELQTALAFALGEFRFVELLARDQEDFMMATNILTSKFLDNVKNYTFKMEKVHADAEPLLYIQVPMAEFLKTEYKYDSNATDQGMVHVHLSEWEPYKSNPNFSLNYTGDHVYKMGITIEDCSKEINQRLGGLIKWPMMRHVSYVVCNAKPILLNNLNIVQMYEYLGTLFYTKSYMKKFLRGKHDTGLEVIFRINVISVFKKCPVDDPEADQFLRFINILNQHSANYKIKYFLVRAFGKQDTCDQCTPSWWRIRNYTDLTDISVYVDRQQQYFREETKLKIELPPEEPKPFINTEHPSGNASENIYWQVTAPVIAALIFLAILALWLQRRHYQNFLSQKEVREFYNGQGENREGIMMGDPDCLDSNSMGFPKRFEVRARDIETQAMIGSGQFGIVYKGYLSNHGVVAIKIPRTDCSKEQFKSTLSELKILCYIGSHENVVSFLGACTKEIAGGKLQILTDYCEHGSLQKYLRERQNETLSKDGASSSVDISQLYEFCYQIACGMEYVAEKRVIHGDLAARNVLLASEYICKISDFGLSRRLYELQEYVKTSTEPLPWRWMAPESLKNMEFTTKSDVWSYGVVLWEIFSLGMLPYPGTSWTPDFITELDSGWRMGKAQHSPDDTHGKILECWTTNPEERPTFAQLKAYFSKLKSKIYLVLKTCNESTKQD